MDNENKDNLLYNILDSNTDKAFDEQQCVYDEELGELVPVVAYETKEEVQQPEVKTTEEIDYIESRIYEISNNPELRNSFLDILKSDENIKQRILACSIVAEDDMKFIAKKLIKYDLTDEEILKMLESIDLNAFSWFSGEFKLVP